MLHAQHPISRSDLPAPKAFSKARVLPLEARRGAFGATRLGIQSLPIIDLSPMFGHNDALKRRVADEIGEAAREVGFFYIKNHSIEPGLIDSAYLQSERFFSLSSDEKLEFDIAKSRNHRGYVPVTERGIYADEQGKRRYEAFDMALDLPNDDPDFVSGHALLGPNVWPRIDGFRDHIRTYYNAVSDLGKMLYRAFEFHLDLPCGYFDQLLTRPTSQLRLIHYLENNDRLDEKDMNMGAHTDYECFTILHQRQPGLQVMNTHGQWIEAPPIDGTFVINIGDMLEVWTNGAFKSNLHRVINNGKERYSMPYFASVNYDAVIEPLPTVTSRKNPQRYNKIVAGDHLFGQLLRDFSYLRERHSSGKLKIDFQIPQGNPFEQTKQQQEMDWAA